MKFIVIILFSCLLAHNAPAIVIDREDVRAFIENMVVKHGFEQEQLDSIFENASISRTIIEAISRPAEKKPWYKYRSIFLRQDRIKLGVEFWEKHKQVLKKAEETYNVPAEIIVAIIGVETRYGKNAGSYQVINSLSTLAFEYPNRSKFFTSELEQYLLMTREQGLDPLAVKGSYAGAMGIPQFISSSYRNYAVDFDNDGVIDIWDNPEDAIGSVGNYFKVHGWQADELIAMRARVKGKKFMALLYDGLKPEIIAGDLDNYDVFPVSELPADIKVVLLDLEAKKRREYWLAMDNFYVITRYNNSAHYAMAVYQLAMEILMEYRVGSILGR